jgi:hypothetical protein
MASQPVPHQSEEPGSPYCSDPNCEYCKNLRQAQEQFTKASAESARKVLIASAFAITPHADPCACSLVNLS